LATNDRGIIPRNLAAFWGMYLPAVDLKDRSTMTPYNPAYQFRDTAYAHGIVIPSNLVLGKLARTGTIDRPGGTDAAYLFHADGIPSGGFQNWRNGRGWQSWRADIGRHPTEEERRAQRAIRAACRRERETEEAHRRAVAQVKAMQIWRSAPVASPDHRYLIKKGIEPHIARERRGCLLLPVRDAAGVLWSLQFIAPDGAKRFLAGGRKNGCYSALGRPVGVICIAEGFATAASIYEATGHAVAVAFDAGNLLAVGQILHTKFPEMELRFCADDDRNTPGNPGLSRAFAAASVVGGTLTLPHFGEGI